MQVGLLQKVGEEEEKWILELTDYCNANAHLVSKSTNLKTVLSETTLVLST